MGSNLRLSYEIGRRFLFSGEFRGVHRLVAGAACLGVGLGVMSLLLVTSAINGFRGELYRVVSQVQGDFFLYTRSEPFSDIQPLAQKVQTLATGMGAEIERIQPALVLEGAIQSSEGFSGALFESAPVALDGEESGTFAMNLAPDEVVLGTELAAKLKVAVGDRVQVAFVRDSSKWHTFSVKAIRKLGLHTYDLKIVYVNLRSMQDKLGLQGKFTTLKFFAPDFFASPEKVEQLQNQIGYPFRVRHWSYLNRNLLAAIYYEKRVIAILIGCIVIVGIFNIVSLLFMLIQDRSKDFSILRAMGLPARSLIQILVFISGYLSFFGVFGGGVLGFLIALILEYGNLIPISAEIYNLSRLPMQFEWSETLGILLGAMGISLLSAVIPALISLRKAPADGLRGD